MNEELPLEVDPEVLAVYFARLEEHKLQTEIMKAQLEAYLARISVDGQLPGLDA